MRRFLLLLACANVSVAAFAQLPQTQVFVFDYTVRDSALLLRNATYLTDFNRGGYNNQPAWIDGDRLLMTVATAGTDQPDVYSFDIAGRTRTRLTSTRSGEYSPKPAANGKRFTAVRQELNGRDTVMRLWEFPMDLSDDGKPVFKYINGIGYYEWLNSVQLAIFLAQTPSELLIANADNDETQPLATRVGRCFKRQPNGNLAYVDKSAQPWKLVEQNLYRMDDPAVIITETLPSQEDFAILPDGSYLMGEGSQLYRFDPANNPKWTQVADLRLYGIRNITRLSVSENGRIALVSNGSI